MKKLKIEDLAVESFTTSSAQGRLGTVAAHVTGETCYNDSEDTFCPVRETLDPCNETNVETCNGWLGGGCGTVYPEATCDLQYGCGGNSLDLQIC